MLPAVTSPEPAADATGSGSSATEPRTEPGTAQAGRLVGRNMLALVASQFVTTPVSMVVNAMLARSLGAANFGAIYLATTVLTLAFLFVEWGGYSQVAATVARDRSKAARILGTGLVLRALMAGALLTGIPWFGQWMGYPPPVQIALMLCGFRLAFVSIGSLCSAVLRGFERIHWLAMATVSGNLMDAVLVAAALLSGGGLREVLVAQATAAALAVVLQLFFIGRLNVGRLRVDQGALQVLVGGGFSFLILDIILKLQPYIDATFMEKWAEPQALGWYSAATRIMGVVMFPALTLNTALYPTLARLWQDDRATCQVMVRLGLRTVTLLGVLAATGTVIFSPFVVGLVYGRAAYAPAAVDLSILSGYVLLVYTSMILGTFLVAAGRQWKWALAQSFCLVVSLVLDPILIPWAQAQYGNGGIGVCVSVVTAEIVMVSSGLLLLPRGVLEWSLVRTVTRCLAAAAGMAVIGLMLRGYPIVAIPITVVVYAALLWVQRELDPELLTLMPEKLAAAFRFVQVRVSRP
jgi:O-antigen/teichoic acid export membrane protein